MRGRKFLNKQSLIHYNEVVNVGTITKFGMVSPTTKRQKSLPEVPRCIRKAKYASEMTLHKVQTTSMHIGFVTPAKPVLSIFLALLWPNPTCYPIVISLTN
jgi:hypothetical protein